MFFALLLAMFAQVGLLFTWTPLKPSFSKLNPISGFKRLFSMQSVMLALINFGKLLVVGVVAYMVFESREGGLA